MTYLAEPSPMAAYGESGSGLLIIERILRDRDGIWRQIGEERDLGKLTRQMLYSSVAALACYGSVLGASGSVLQAVLSAARLPLLFLMTLRPFVGSPGEPFEIFRKIEGNFYGDIVRAIGDLFT